MTKNDKISRRDALARGSAFALASLFAGGMGELHAEELEPPVAGVAADDKSGDASPVAIAVIGLGEQGRNLLTSLGYVAGANVTYVCDTYAPSHKKALELAPKAKNVTDYKQVLGDAAVKGVFVATPSHLHKQIVADALAAGKAVYCEAPLASTVAEAKEIALLAKAKSEVIFHVGLPYRTNPQHNHVYKFVETGALAKVAQGKAQWHKKQSWRRAAPSDERQNALNWRLKRATSGGLVGEIGIHQIDVATRFLGKNPVAVSGFGGILAWNDGRDVPDTVQCVLEYPGGVHIAYDATLANSFDGAYELFQGTDAAVLLRDARAWMFKEADAPALGWEVYAYKEKLGDETGIALVADASKLLAEGKKPSENRDADPKRSALYHACNVFLNAIRTGKGDPEAAASVGHTATVIALTANEAILTGKRIAFTPEMFTT
ncbi:MAG: Gfo/Idh/MocA family oxidoreductase [Fibrella sp.]|nr:Gfo/Idh/MocA family oxidoreductase [Armatimonadota bacterium]